MIGIITEFGKRVSTRWVTAILLPGSLWVIVFGIAVVLGHGSPFDLARLVAETEALGDEFVRHPGRAVVAVVLAVAGAGVAGTVATGLGRLAQRWFLRRRFLTGGLITRSRWSRRSRALAAARRAGVDPVAAYLPQRPTWLGDRVRLVEARVRAQYHVDARLVWPRLWLLLDEDTRRPIAMRMPATPMPVTDGVGTAVSGAGRGVVAGVVDQRNGGGDRVDEVACDGGGTGGTDRVGHRPPLT